MKPCSLRRAATTLALLASSLAWAADAPPVAPVRDVPETFFGTKVDDPYRYFEDTKAPEVAAWMKAHSDHAHALLQRIGGRDALRAKLERLDASAPARVTAVDRVRGDLYFYERRGVKDDQFKLYMRKGLAGKEKLLFDPETLKRATGKPHAINYFTPSPDGRWVALGVSAAGSEDAAIRIIDTRSGKQVGPEITRAQFGAQSWSPDGELFFNRLQELKPGMPATDKYQRSSVVALKPGQAEKDLRTVLQAGEALGIPATEFPYLDVQPDGRVILYVVDGVSPDFSAWHSTLAAVRAGKPGWQPLAAREDRITALQLKDDQVFMLSFRDAPRYKLLGGPLQGFSPAKAEVLMPESDKVLTSIGAAADGLYVALRDGNVKRLMKLAYAPGAKPQEVKLPVQGNFSFAGVRPELPGVLLDLQGWTRARQIYAVAPGGVVRNTGLQPAGPYDAPDDVVAEEVMVKSHDGAMVPMSIIHKRGIKLDGNNPTLLYGYASYGITEEPWFSYNRLAWMDAGGVFAVANPRGSGVFGRAWHEAGRQTTKPNTWKDFIACAEYLVAQKWTSPKRLGIWGGSAGGILVGRAMTERPDLFGVVVPSVGLLDAVRAETTPNGVPNIPEFGTRANEAGFRALLEMSTYHHVKQGTAYPAVLLVHGANDPRVEPWMSTKTAARLMAATSSGKPVLMRLNYEAGHGIGNTKSQIFDEVADIYAFALWQMGMPGYELK
ncbi:MAG: prolyl oligopeptidase family serine peptidase [Pseudomonadota bacterium]